MKKYMFDTNIYNRKLDGKLDIELSTLEAEFLATHIQIDELRNTKDSSRRADLIQIFDSLSKSELPTESFVLDISRLDSAKLSGRSLLPTESFVWDVSRWGMAKWGEKPNLYELIKKELDLLKNKPNNSQDALIAETAILNGICLVTTDSDLKDVVIRIGGDCMNLKEFTSEFVE